MAGARVRRTSGLVLRILLTLVSLAAGVPKFLPRSGWSARFTGWGYPHWFLLAVGVAEIAGALGLWLPWTARPALAVLGAIMLGALYTNLTHPPALEALRPLIYLGLILALAALQLTAPDPAGVTRLPADPA